MICIENTLLKAEIKLVTHDHDHLTLFVRASFPSWLILKRNHALAIAKQQNNFSNVSNKAFL